MTMTAAWVREGDIQAGPMVAEDGQGTRIHQVPEAGAVIGLKGNHDHAGSPDHTIFNALCISTSLTEILEKLIYVTLGCLC